MPSPAKKRKLNAPSAPTPLARGLEYFFSKQKQNGASSRATAVPADDEAAGEAVLSDEELARKLQAEWDAEERRLLKRQAEEKCKTSALPLLTEAKASRMTEDAETVDEAGKMDAAATVPSSTDATTAVDTADDVSAIPLDVSPLAFDPRIYTHLVQDGAPYALLTRCFVLVSGTRSRLRMVDTLVNTLRLLIEGDPASVRPAVWLATNAIGPPYVARELGLGGAAIGKALQRACGLDARQLRTLFSKHGDAGDVAYEAKRQQQTRTTWLTRRPKRLTIAGVYGTLCRVAACQGGGSVEAKQRLVDGLLQAAGGSDESRFLVRTLCQHLRIGAVQTTVLIALARAFVLSRPADATWDCPGTHGVTELATDARTARFKAAEECVKSCFARRPNYDDLVTALLAVGVTADDGAALRACCGLTLHVPLRPMLGAVTRNVAAALDRLRGHGSFACEFKYDGQRAQLHRDADGRVSLFSRNLEDMTDKYPDVVAAVPAMLRGATSFVLEGEIVAVDRASGALRTFQTLANRARRDVAVGSITVDVCLFAFDLMMLDGQPLLDQPLRARRALLRSRFAEVPGHFTWVESMDATAGEAEAVSAFFQRATAAKCEGIMVKVLGREEGEEERQETGKGEQYEEDEGPDDDDDEVERDDDEKNEDDKNEDEIEKEDDENNGDEKNGAKTKLSKNRKPLLATYEPDRRLESWLKVKKDYGAAHDTLDLVPVAAWHGMGRKSQWWSPILMAVRNEETGSLEAVCKCMSGFSDVFYKENRAKYDVAAQDADEEAEETNETKPNTHRRKPPFVDYNGPEPNVWFEPQEVWEMAFADITLSPTYTAALGLVSEDRGLSLRFPRFVRRREDKGLDEASTNEFLAALYRKQ